MKIFLISLATAVFAFVIFLLFSKITLSFNAEKKKGKEFKTYFEICFLGGLLKLKKSVNGKKSNKKLVKDSLKKSGIVKDEDRFFQKVKKAYNTFCAFKYAYKTNSGRVRKAVYAKKINLHINFGTGNAAATGIITGALWSGIYNVISFISGIITIAEPNINVIPNYDDKECSVKCECIIISRLVNLIGAAAGIGISYLKFKRKQKNINKNNKI